MSAHDEQGDIKSTFPFSNQIMFTECHFIFEMETILTRLIGMVFRLIGMVL